MKIKSFLIGTALALTTLKGTPAAEDGGNLREILTVLRQPGAIGFFRDEVDDAFLDIALMATELEHLREQNELLEDDQLELAMLLSQGEGLIGGHSPAGTLQHLETLIAALGQNALTLDEAVQSLTVLLAETPGDDVHAKINYLFQERKKEKVTKHALQKVISAQAQEQRESTALLHDVLTQRAALYPPAISTPTTPTKETLQPPSCQPLPSSCLPPHVSDYQRQLLTQRAKIGDKAWDLLGGRNLSLATALFNAIQQNLSHTPTAHKVDILYLGSNNFTLRVNGVGHKLYKY